MAHEFAPKRSSCHFPKANNGITVSSRQECVIWAERHTKNFTAALELSYRAPRGDIKDTKLSSILYVRQSRVVMRKSHAGPAPRQRFSEDLSPILSIADLEAIITDGGNQRTIWRKSDVLRPIDMCN
jgi:hypothetical protein